MIFLLLTIIANTLIALGLRLADGRSGNRMALFSVNYAVCLALSAAYGGRGAAAGGNGFPVLFGALTGFLFLATFILFKRNIAQNGIILSSTFMKLGVIIPTLSAVLLFHEKPGVSQVIGFFLAILAILVMNRPDKSETKETGERKGRLLLPVLLLVSGLTDAMLNVFDERGSADKKDLFLCCVFGMALLCAAAFSLREKKPVKGKDVLFGCLVGVPNYYASRFLLAALAEIPAVVTYPVVSVGTILLLGVSGTLLFRERLKKNEWVAMTMILVALVLLNR